MEKKKSLKQFEAELRETLEFTAEIAFWYAIIYQEYVRGKIDYATAINKVKEMKNYNGV